MVLLSEANFATWQNWVFSKARTSRTIVKLVKNCPDNIKYRKKEIYIKIIKKSKKFLKPP